MIDNTAFEEICFTTQDVYFVVRRDLFVKYRKYIAKKRHQSRWYIIPFLSAHDPELEVRELVSYNQGLRPASALIGAFTGWKNRT